MNQQATLMRRLRTAATALALLAAGCSGAAGTASPAGTAIPGGAVRLPPRPYFPKAALLNADRGELIRVLETEIHLLGGGGKANCLLRSIPPHVNIEVLRLSIGQTAIDNRLTDLTVNDLKDHAAAEIARDPRGVAYDQDRYAAISRACGL